jgi:hypothetical protein
MFIGHAAVAFGAKKAAPGVSLGTLLLAAMFLDVLWPVLLLLGLERVRIDPGHTRFSPLDFESYPWSHSLLFSLVWSLVFALAYLVWRRNRRGAIVAGLCVASHWILDFVVHRADLPLWPGGPRVGLDLWNSVAGTLFVEGGLFAAGLLIYLAATAPRDRAGVAILFFFVVVLLALYVAAFIGPPPPNARMIAWADLGSLLLVAWGYWIDRHRKTRA